MDTIDLRGVLPEFRDRVLHDLDVALTKDRRRSLARPIDVAASFVAHYDGRPPAEGSLAVPTLLSEMAAKVAEHPDTEIADEARGAIDALQRVCDVRLGMSRGPTRPPQVDEMLPTLVRVYDLLEADGPLTSKVVAQRLGVAKASVAKSLGSLRKHGLLVEESDPDDGRVKWLSVPTAR